jgi:hypothetical protein
MVLARVLGALARSHGHFFPEEAPAIDSFPTIRFLEYFINARDAVASSDIDSGIELLGDPESGVSATDLDDPLGFWSIVGLIESGSLSEASERLKTYKPSDGKFLLGIHLSCFLVENLRIATKEEKQLASDMCRRIEPKIASYADRVKRELSSLLLEKRGSRIVGVRPTKRLQAPKSSRS